MKHWSKRTGGQGARVARRTGLRASPCGWGQWSCTDALNSWLPRTHVESVVDDYFSPVVVTLWSREQQFSKSRVLHQPKRPRMSGPAQRTDTTMSCHTSAHARTTRPSRACPPLFHTVYTPFHTKWYEFFACFFLMHAFMTDPGNMVSCTRQPCARDPCNRADASAHGMGSGVLAVDAVAIGCLGAERRGFALGLCDFVSV